MARLLFIYFSKLPINEYIHLEARDASLEVYDGYSQLRFRLVIDKPNQWKETFDNLIFERLSELSKRLFEKEVERPMELEKLLER